MLSDDQKAEIEAFAGCFFSPDEIHEITGVNPQVDGFKEAFRRGSLISESEIRKSIISLAKSGSSPAQTLAWKMLEQQKRNSI